MGAICSWERVKTEKQERLIQKAQTTRTFREPARVIGRAGGTASLYKLETLDGPTLHEDWLGKDLERAYDELEFYEIAKYLPQEICWSVTSHFIQYGGVLGNFPVGWSNGETRNKDLLVMRSLVEGFAGPRLLDLKIGAKTSDANWMGKSSLHSRKQDVIDRRTNSAVEGLRLEGFLNPPPWIDSEDPMQDLWFYPTSPSSKSGKKAKRLAFQRKSTSDILLAAIDLRSAGASLSGSASGGQKDAASSRCLCASEYGELVILEIIRKLRSILGACLQIPVPQKWIGSSVAICLDASTALPRPDRGGSVTSVLDGRCRIVLFDWGRSELNTPVNHASLQADVRQNRADFWALYLCGLCRLLWEASRIYWNTFCVAKWHTLRIKVWDYDSSNDNDFLGEASMSMPDAVGSFSGSLTLTDAFQKPVIGADGQKSQVSLEISFHACPLPSRMQGLWNVRLLCAKHLKAADPTLISKRTSDPFAVVMVEESTGCQRKAQARSNTVIADLNPVWEESFEFPVVAGEDMTNGTDGCSLSGCAALCEALTLSISPSGMADALSTSLSAPKELGRPATDDGQLVPPEEQKFLKLCQLEACTEARDFGLSAESAADANAAGTAFGSELSATESV